MGMADYDNATQKASSLDIPITLTGALRRGLAGTRSRLPPAA